MKKLITTIHAHALPVIFIVLCILFSGCSSAADNNTPSAADMKSALHARAVSIDDYSIKVIITEDGIDQNTIYSALIEDCEFYIDRDVISEDYPLLIIPVEPFKAEETSLKAIKIYGFSN